MKRRDTGAIAAAPSTPSRRDFARLMGLSAAGLALAGCSAPDVQDSGAIATAEDDRDVAPTQNAASQAAITPDGALDLLAQGNARFVAGTPALRDLGDQVVATASGQHPFAVVLGCIDSRVPVEVVFDQGIGDIFSARVAGNVVNTELLGSMEFACRVAGSRAVVVLGHTACGAVKGAIAGARLGNLTQLVQKIEPAVEAVGGERNAEDAGYVDRVAETNVRFVLDEIRQKSPVLSEMEQAGEIRIVGAMYDIGTGAVRFL